MAVANEEYNDRFIATLERAIEYPLGEICVIYICFSRYKITINVDENIHMIEIE